MNCKPLKEHFNVEMLKLNYFSSAVPMNERYIVLLFPSVHIRQMNRRGKGEIVAYLHNPTRISPLSLIPAIVAGSTLKSDKVCISDK